MGIVDGHVFQKVGKTSGTIRRAQISDLNPMFHAILKRVQLLWPSVILDSVKVEKDMSMFRLIRQGLPLQAQNVHLPKEVIEANNRWKKALKAF
jgi:hypothetical protein